MLKLGNIVSYLCCKQIIITNSAFISCSLVVYGIPRVLVLEKNSNIQRNMKIKINFIRNMIFTERETSGFLINGKQAFVY